MQIDGKAIFAIIRVLFVKTDRWPYLARKKR